MLQVDDIFISTQKVHGKGGVKAKFRGPCLVQQLRQHVLCPSAGLTRTCCRRPWEAAGTVPAGRSLSHLEHVHLIPGSQLRPDLALAIAGSWGVKQL